MRCLALVLAIAACHKADPEPSPTPTPAPIAAPAAHHEDRHDPMTPAKVGIEVAIGTAKSAWTEAAFTGTPKLAGTASDGEARDTWSLRELAHHNVGATARVTAVVGATGKQPIDQAAWDDATKTPILHTTKRGALKFRWADKDGKWGETVLKDVTALEIAP